MIGAGLGGLAAAARLAKLGHAVTAVERSPQVGGVVQTLERSHEISTTQRVMFRWDSGPASMTLPAALRDLFRKSGRPLERVAELAPVTSPRRHVFADGTVLDLPVGSRSGQFRALEHVLGGATANAWQSTLDDLTTTWELLRTHALEAPFRGVRDLGPAGLRALVAGGSLRSFARRHLPDSRARSLLEHAVVGSGSDPGRAPAFTAVHAYVERTFGQWTCPGGFGRLAGALGERLRERKVDLRLGTEVAEVLTSAGRVNGVGLGDGERLAAELVVSGVDVRTLAGMVVDAAPRPLRRAARTVTPAPVSHVVHLGLRDAPELPYETVLHGGRDLGPADREEAPCIVVRAPDDPDLAPAGYRAVTVEVLGDRRGTAAGEGSAPAGGAGADPLDVLAGRGLDLRHRVVVRVDRDAASYGPTWRGLARGRGLVRNRTPLSGLYAVGGTAHPGPGVPSVLLGAAAVAQDIGRA